MRYLDMDVPVIYLRTQNISSHPSFNPLCSRNLKLLFSLIHSYSTPPVVGAATCTQELERWHSIHSKNTVSLHSRWWMCECINAVFLWHNIVHCWEYTCASTRDAILWHPGSWQQLLLQRSPQDLDFMIMAIAAIIIPFLASCLILLTLTQTSCKMFDSNSIHHGD